MRVALPFVAIAVAAGFAVVYLLRMSCEAGSVAPPPSAASAESPPIPRSLRTSSPDHRVIAPGVVEPSEENIPVGTPVSGVVTQVLVKAGQQVQAGTGLFSLDDRPYQGTLRVRQAALVSTQTDLERLQQMPRPELLPVAEAKLREAKAQLTAQQDLFNRSAGLRPLHAIAEEEYVVRKQAYETARHQVVRTEAELALLRAGAWEPEKRVARAAVARAKAEVEQAMIDLDRLLVRAPANGHVLQVNVRPGEAVGSPYPKSLIVLGNLTRLHVRVDVDARDISRFRPDGSAKASPRGQVQPEYPLDFVRVVPYVVPKSSFAPNGVSGCADPRVLQVIYAIRPDGRPLYVGQQMEVSLDMPPEPSPGQGGDKHVP